MAEYEWKPDFKKWYVVNKDAYKLIFEQAEKKLEDVLSESESITNKSIKLITIVAAMFAFFVGFLVQSKTPLGYNSIFIGLLLINAGGITYLIFPKQVRGRGFAPATFLLNNLDSEEDKGFQEELLYYNGLVLLQGNIDFMRAKNKCRAKIYMVGLSLTFVLFIIGTIIISQSI